MFATRVALLGCTLALVAPVHAQDMDFTQDPQFQQARTQAQAGPPSEILVRAHRAYQKQRYAEAAVQLQRVVEGDSDDVGAQVRRAEFTLAKSLVHLGYDESALALLDGISEAGRRHPHFRHALPWLAELGRRMPDPAPIALAVGRYRPQDLEAIESTSEDDVDETRAFLGYLMGRQAYADGELGAAVKLLADVPAEAPEHLRARFVEGLAHVRMRRARPAIASFRAMLEAIEEDGNQPDAERMRNLAWLSLGRVYYTAALQQGSDGGELLGAAVDAFSRVDNTSEHWLDALFESGWALFVADQQARALGNLHALLSPFFPGAFYPEAYVLKAVTFYQACQMHNAMAMVGAFRDRYDGLRQELQTAAGGLDEEGGFALLEAARAGTLRGSPALQAVLTRGLSDREVLRQHQRVESIGDQRRRLKEAPAALARSSLGERILQDLLVAESFARAHAGALVQSRITRLGEELQELANQMDTIEIEVIGYTRGNLGKATPYNPNPAGGVVEVDSEHVLWPFNGEYWRDELGYYRQEVTHHCAPR